MLDLFVAALMTVADPTVVAQAPTTSAVAMSAQSKKPSSSQGYEGTYKGCQDVQNLKPDSAHNSFSPLTGIPAQNNVPIDKLDPKITVLEAPKHGKVKIINSEWYHYRFIPDKDYLGKDRVVYQVEAEGKRYKVILNFWIVPIVWDSKGEEQYAPECQDQKFNGSSITPDSTIGGGGPQTNGTSNSVIVSVGADKYCNVLCDDGMNYGNYVE